jgi:hypothetical protein
MTRRLFSFPELIGDRAGSRHRRAQIRYERAIETLFLQGSEKHTTITRSTLDMSSVLSPP